MREREEAINNYGHAWKKKDLTGAEKYFDKNMNVKDHFAKDIKFNLDTLKKEIESLPMEEINLKIINFVHQGEITVVDWQLQCIEDGKNKKYEGLSLFKFSSSNLIVEIREHATEVTED